MGEGAAAPKPGDPRRALLAELRAVEREWRRVTVQLWGEALRSPAVMRIVRGGPTKGHPIYEIERRMIYRFANVTRLVDRLELQGLLSRRPVGPRSVQPRDG